MEKSQSCNINNVKNSNQNFSDCIMTNVKESINKLSESKSQITKYRDVISNRLRNYTCADESLNTSTPLYSKRTMILNKPFMVHTLFETSHAKIWSVDDFISDEECDILMNYGAPRLQRATVAAEDGSSTVSINRRAQQAGYHAMHHNPNDPLW